MAALQLSTAYLGAPLVTLNPSYSPRELARALKHVGASTLLIVPSLRGSDYTAHLPRSALSRHGLSGRSCRTRC